MAHLRVALVLAIAIASCSGLDNLDVEAEGVAVVPAGTVLDELLGDLAFAGFGDIDIQDSQEFENQGYTKDQIDSVYLQSITLTIEQPAGANFDFVSSVAFFAEADGQPRVEIARAGDIPDGATELAMIVDAGVDLTAYAVAPSMTITTEATGRRPSQETHIHAAVILDVDVRITGACR